MKIFAFPEVEKTISGGGIGVLPTDTIYGIVGKALNRSSVEKIYKVKGRKPDKPLIILISEIKDLKLFNIVVDEKTQKLLNKFWPGKVSIILPCPSGEFEYLHRGTSTLAFRLPDFPELTGLINKTGPLVAPSANPEGMAPARDISQAEKYFGESIDFYVDNGVLESLPSTLIQITNGIITVLREGAVKIES